MARRKEPPDSHPDAPWLVTEHLLREGTSAYDRERHPQRQGVPWPYAVLT